MQTRGRRGPSDGRDVTASLINDFANGVQEPGRGEHNVTGRSFGRGFGGRTFSGSSDPCQKLKMGLDDPLRDRRHLR